MNYNQSIMPSFSTVFFVSFSATFFLLISVRALSICYNLCYNWLRKKGMLFALLSIYIGWLLGLVVTTVCLIVCGYGWGPLPHIYLRLVKFLQSFYPQSYPQAETMWPAIIKRCDMSSLKNHHNDSLSSFKFRYHNLLLIIYHVMILLCNAALLWCSV